MHFFSFLVLTFSLDVDWRKVAEFGGGR